MEIFGSSRTVRIAFVFLVLFIICWTFFRIHKNKLPVAIEQSHLSFPETNYNVIFGKVNIHQWFNICCASTTCLRKHAKFPLHADKRSVIMYIREFRVSIWTRNSARRIMGYLQPGYSGVHTFQLKSKSPSEMWLSLSDSPAQAKRYGVYKLSIHLSQRQKYYFEILHVTKRISKEQISLKVTVKSMEVIKGVARTLMVTPFLPGNYNGSSLLESSPTFQLFQFPDSTKRQSHAYEWFLREYSNRKPSANFKLYTGTKRSFHELPDIDMAYISSVFPHCRYQPSSTKKRDWKRYEGAVYGTNFSDVYPADGTGNMTCEGDWKLREQCYGNDVIFIGEVTRVIRMFITALNRKLERMYSLESIFNIERKVDQEKGNRYLLELILKSHAKSTNVKMIGFFFWPKRTKKLCKLDGMTLNNNVPVNMVITAKYQGAWVEYFIRNIARVLKVSRDENVHIILVDCGENNLDIEKEFKRRGITKFTIIRQHGKFSKTLAIQRATRGIRDPNSIVFLMDLHVHMPDDVIRIVRKHTFQNKVAFSPILLRLARCRTYGIEPYRGFWEIQGYGLFSTYKSDWDAFGGMNVKEYGSRWGGEDWEMVDRVLNHGIEIEKLRLPGLFHYYHDHKRLWEHSPARR